MRGFALFVVVISVWSIVTGYHQYIALFGLTCANIGLAITQHKKKRRFVTYSLYMSTAVAALATIMAYREYQAIVNLFTTSASLYNN